MKTITTLNWVSRLTCYIAETFYALHDILLYASSWKLHESVEAAFGLLFCYSGTIVWLYDHLHVPDSALDTRDTTANTPEYTAWHHRTAMLYTEIKCGVQVTTLTWVVRRGLLEEDTCKLTSQWWDGAVSGNTAEKSCWRSRHPMACL